jgi:putative transposase
MIKKRRGSLGDTWYMDEVYIVTVRGERGYLWCAVDQDGDVLDILVQKRKDKKAAERFFKKLMKGQGRSAREIVTDKLAGYGAARKAVMPTSMHCHERYANNRAEESII